MDREMTAQPNFEEIAGVVIRRLKLFIVPAFVIFITALLIGSILPKTYETSSLVEIKSKNIIEPVVKESQPNPDRDNAFIGTLEKQITAWPKLEELVTHLHLADKIQLAPERERFIKSFKNKIRIGLKYRDIVEIAFQDNDPVKAQKVVNALTQELIDTNSSLQKQDSRSAIDFIQQQLAIYRSKLDNSQVNVMLNKMDADLRAARNKKLLIMERIQNTQKIIPSQAANEQNTVLFQLKSRLGTLEAELARVSYDAKENNPRVLDIQNEIQSIKDKINTEVESSNTKPNAYVLNPTYLESKQELAKVEMEIEYLKNHLQDMESQGKKVPENISEEELANLERNRMVDEDIYKMLLRQLESAYVSERLEDTDKGDKFAVIEYARLPLQPIKPKIAMIAFMGLVLGSLTGFGLVFAVENISDAFQTKEQVQDILGIPLLSSVSKMVMEQDRNKINMFLKFKEWIKKLVNTNKMLSGLSFVSPHIAKKIRDKTISAQLVVFHEPNCVISDEFRILRTHIFHGTDEQMPPKTLMLTSTLRGEGKSTTSSNLATAIADSGRRTLLLDCDLRKGTIGNLFSLPVSKGLISVLSGEIGADLAIRNTKISNLSVLPAGGRNERPSELLDSPEMDVLMKKLKEIYDYIIIDSPPITNLPDASIMSRLADAVIMVIQAGRAKKKDVTLALEKLQHIDTRVMGFVLTNVQYYMPRYIYDYYYNYN